MEKKLFVLLFLTGIVPLVQSIPRKFYLIKLNKNWTAAQTYCQTHHTDLATIENPADMNRLQAEAQEHKFRSIAWIGVYKVLTDWCWSINNETLENWTSWNPGEPNNLGYECVVMYKSKWWDYPCTNFLTFLCYDDRMDGKNRYIYYNISKTWSEAQSFCRHNHSDLVIIRDTAEQSIIMENIPQGTSYVWIGLYRNKDWIWSDQTNVTTITWASGKPDNSWWKICGYVQNRLIYNAWCSYTMPFFCYSVITGQQQIIRMKVQSDQEVNDPAVQAVILEQIQQNLKDHGIANVTVKFRKQPGGTVFHKLEEKKTAV